MQKLWNLLQKYFFPLRYYGIAIIIFLLGVVLSLSAFNYYINQEINEKHIEFDRLAEHRLFILRDLLLSTLEQVDIIKQFFIASDEVTEKEFNVFVRAFLDFYQNILAIGWIEEDAIQPSMNKKPLGIEFINTTQTSLPNPSLIFPFTFLEKTNLNPFFSIDISEYTKFIDLLKRSRLNPGMTTVASRINFFQEGKKQGFFLAKAILVSELALPPSNKNDLFGTVVCFSSFDEIFKNIRSQIEPVEIDIGIYDITDGNQELLYWSEAMILKDRVNPSPRVKAIQDRLTHYYILQYGNRMWELKAAPTLEYINKKDIGYFSYWELPILGILLSGLLSSYFLVLANRRILIQQEVNERTNELANTNIILQQEIHERQKIEEDYYHKQLYLQKKHEALEYLTKLTASELPALHEVILRTAIVMQIDRVSVWFYETIDDTQILSCSGLYNLSTNSFTNQLEFNSIDFPHYFNALSQKSHLILPSATDDKLNQELSSYFAVFHITSKLDIPIVFEGKLLGVLSCEETRGYREWELEDRHFGQTIADIVAIMIEQSAKRKAEKALVESEERLRFISQKAVDGIISLNDKDEIISWNVGAEKMFGYIEMEMLGKSIQVIILKNNLILKEMTTKSIELKGQDKDGRIFPVEVSLSPWQSGESNYYTVIIRDITERKENEKRLIKAIREAKAANEAKNEFLATISHELRTPLNAIIGFDQCLLMGMDGAINEAQKVSLKKIEKSSFHLLSLISDILDFSKIEAKKMELEIIPHNIVEIVVSSVDEMQSLANQKNLTISLEKEKPFILVEVDKVRIRQVMLNLLSNAIKFTEKGAINVKIVNYPNKVSIHVKDTGIGLTQEEIDKIFHPFSQADSSITRKYGGTGLGLVISKKIIDYHGGSLNAESEKGKGSTFIVTLPKVQ